MSTLYSDLINNLRLGMAFALFRRRSLSAFRVGVDQAIGLILLSLTVEVVSDFLLNLPRPRFIADALSVYSLSLVLFTLAAYLFAGMLKRRGATLQFLVVAYSATFLLYLVAFVVEYATRGFTDPGDTLWSVVVGTQLLWLLLILLRAIYHVAERDKKSTVAGGVILIAVWLVPMVAGGWERQFWYPEPLSSSREDPYAEYRKMDGEGVMYAQPELLQQALAQLEPGRAGVTDLYFIGVAGYAYQDVFARCRPWRAKRRPVVLDRRRCCSIRRSVA